MGAHEEGSHGALARAVRVVVLLRDGLVRAPEEQTAEEGQAYAISCLGRLLHGALWLRRLWPGLLGFAPCVCRRTRYEKLVEQAFTFSYIEALH